MRRANGDRQTPSFVYVQRKKKPRGRGEARKRISGARIFFGGFGTKTSTHAQAWDIQHEERKRRREALSGWTLGVSFSFVIVSSSTRETNGPEQTQWRKEKERMPLPPWSSAVSPFSGARSGAGSGGRSSPGSTGTCPWSSRKGRGPSSRAPSRCPTRPARLGPWGIPLCWLVGRERMGVRRNGIIKVHTHNKDVRREQSGPR